MPVAGDVGVVPEGGRKYARVVSDDIGRDRAALEPELIETRRVLHRHPELGFTEHETAALVTERLRALG
jgi:hypothetical protein